jgi:hypothetical protein
MGLNSADLLVLQRQIEKKFAQVLKPGFFFEYTTSQKVITYLCSRLAPEEDALPAGPTATVVAEDLVTVGADEPLPSTRARDYRESDIAIVGMSCKLPGDLGHEHIPRDPRSMAGELRHGGHRSRWIYPRR